MVRTKQTGRGDGGLGLPPARFPCHGGGRGRGRRGGRRGAFRGTGGDPPNPQNPPPTSERPELITGRGPTGPTAPRKRRRKLVNSEIRYLQKSTHLLCSKAEMHRYVFHDKLSSICSFIIFLIYEKCPYVVN